MKYDLTSIINTRYKLFKVAMKFIGYNVIQETDKVLKFENKEGIIILLILDNDTVHCKIINSKTKKELKSWFLGYIDSEIPLQVEDILKIMNTDNFVKFCEEQPKKQIEEKQTIDFKNVVIHKGSYPREQVEFIKIYAVKLDSDIHIRKEELKYFGCDRKPEVYFIGVAKDNDIKEIDIDKNSYEKLCSFFNIV